MQKRILPKGAYFHKMGNDGLPKIQSKIQINEKQKSLGYFIDIISPKIIFDFVREEYPKAYKSGKNHHMYGKKCLKHSKRMSGKNNPRYGKHFSKETLKKMSKAKEGKYLRKSNPNWKGGSLFILQKLYEKYKNIKMEYISSEDIFYDRKYFTQNIRKRDNYTCQRCNSTINSKKYPLVGHHIIPVNVDPSKMCDPTNCITLCFECHQGKGSIHNVYGNSYESEEEFWDWFNSYKPKVEVYEKQSVLI